MAEKYQCNIEIYGKQNWYIRKYFKGKLLGTTGVIYDDERRVERDFKALTEKAVPYVKYKIVGPISQI